MVESAPLESLDPADDVEYQAVEPWAIIGLLLGLISPIALVAPVLWFVPILGLVAAAVALRNLRRDRRPGRALALVGLVLSTIFIAAPVTRIFSAEWLLSRQARPVADQFMEYLRERSPEKALMLVFAPDQRRPIDDTLWLYVRSDDEVKGELRKFVDAPPIRMLLALGDEARVRFYRTGSVATSGKIAQVNYVYSVTFDDEDGKTKTYFVALRLERKPTAKPDINPWRVRDYGGGFDPT
jgi:hypothetical protein